MDKEEARELTVQWLENNQSQGAFDGFSEENMNFSELDDKSIEYYLAEWVYEDYSERGEECEEMVLDIDEFLETNK